MQVRIAAQSAGDGTKRVLALMTVVTNELGISCARCNASLGVIIHRGLGPIPNVAAEISAMFAGHQCTAPPLTKAREDLG